MTDLFGGRMRLVRLRDGDSHIILGSEITFFNIMSTKLIQYGFKMTEESLFFCGDEPLNPKFYAEVKGASWLLHEAFCLYAEKEKFKPYEKHHSTVRDVCQTAEELRVKNLILMHTEDSHIQDRRRLYKEEGEKVYSGRLWVPDAGRVFLLIKLMEVFMYERMLNKQETPGIEEMTKFCDENAERFSLLNEWLVATRQRIK